MPGNSNAVATPGNFARVFVNGYEVTADSQQISYHHTYADNKVGAQNTGIETHQPGAFDPKLAYNGYARRGSGAITAHNLLFPGGLGSTNDTEYLISMPLGFNAPPAQGDSGVLFDGTLLSYKRQNPLAGLMTFQANFASRGKRMPPFPILLDLQSAIKTTTNTSSTPYDDGTEASSGTTAGGVVVLQIFSPTGTAATGSISLNGQPSDGDTFTIGGTVYTFKTALTPTIGQVLIGANTAATIANLYAAITGGYGAGTAYATGTTSFSQLLLSATVFFAPPTAANVINITYATTGVSGNSFTLAKTGTNTAISGATLSAGVAPDLYSVTVGTATTSGGSYTTIATFSNVGGTRAAYRVEVPIGTTLQEFWKVTYTLSSGSGTAQSFAACVMAGRFFV